MSSILVKLEFRVLHFEEGEKLENLEKNPQSNNRTNNKLDPHMAKGRNQTQATLVGEEHSHHYAIPAPLKCESLSPD